ncbi:unnamed protein product [Lathyrus sativus]|nr:unnamed protein product [Lathyrus sativus]
MNHDQQDKPSFFAIIKENFNQLKVPQKIVMNLGEELWNKELIILIGSSGEKWQVSILKKGNDMYLQNTGWEQFMKDNSVVNEEFLVFTYNGENMFHVKFFGRNGLERPSFKKEEVAAEAPTVVKRKRGRPSFKKEEKVAAEAPIVVKRKRGRPRKNPAAETVCAKKEKEKEAPETVVARKRNDEPRKALAAQRVCVKKEKEEAVETMEIKRNKGRRPRKSAPPAAAAVVIIID